MKFEPILDNLNINGKIFKISNIKLDTKNKEIICDLYYHKNNELQKIKENKYYDDYALYVTSTYKTTDTYQRGKLKLKFSDIDLQLEELKTETKTYNEEKEY